MFLCRLWQFLTRKKDAYIASFCYTLAELQVVLQALIDQPEARARFEADPTKNFGGTHRLQGFKDNIMTQCQAVYERHDAMEAEKYRKDDVYRRVVTEMLEMKMMAVSKMRNWLENKTPMIEAMAKALPIQAISVPVKPRPPSVTAAPM